MTCGAVNFSSTLAACSCRFILSDSLHNNTYNKERKKLSKNFQIFPLALIDKQEKFCTQSKIKPVFVQKLFRYVIKELVHAFSCAYIELWMYLGSLESTQEARVALVCASSNSYASLVLSKLPGETIPRYTHAKHGPILY